MKRQNRSPGIADSLTLTHCAVRSPAMSGSRPPNTAGASRGSPPSYTPIRSDAERDVRESSKRSSEPQAAVEEISSASFEEPPSSCAISRSRKAFGASSNTSFWAFPWIAWATTSSQQISGSASWTMLSDDRRALAIASGTSATPRPWATRSRSVSRSLTSKAMRRSMPALSKPRSIRRRVPHAGSKSTNGSSATEGHFGAAGQRMAGRADQHECVAGDQLRRDIGRRLE